MSTERKGIEFFVGLFLLIGFAVIAFLAVLFGRAGQGMEKFYPVRVRFPNASGLVRGSDVLLSGARIGTVSTAPTLVGDHYQVEVQLGIRESVRIPRVAAFQIRSNGMLGDSYVDVMVPATFDPNDVAQPGELIAGQRTGGLDDLERKGTEMIDTLNKDILRKLSSELDDIKIATTSLNEELLSKKNMANLEETLANLRTSSAEFSKASRDLDLVVSKTQEAVDSAKITLKTVDGAAGDLRLGIGDFRKVADSARSLLNKANNGEGPLGMLLTDKQAADNLKALITNMRHSGVLFYKDRPLPISEPTSTPTPKPAPRRH